MEQLKKEAEKEFKEKILLRTGEIKLVWGNEISEGNYREDIIKFINSKIDKAYQQGKKEVIEDIKKIITDEFYKLEEIEKDFKINQEIIRTRNKIIKLLK